MAKVSAKSATKWSHLKQFHLGVSMGSGHHHGERLAAIVDWFNQQGFENGLIDVSDTLNRYNYMKTGISELESLEITRREGVKWKIQNKDILAELKMPVRIIHWDYWLDDPRFKSYYADFEAAFGKNPLFRIAVMQDIERHYMRKYSQGLHERSEMDIELSKQFYFEELAVLSIQFANYPCVEVYPGRELDCVKMVRSGKVKNVPDGLSKAIYAALFLHDIGAEMVEKA